MFKVVKPPVVSKALPSACSHEVPSAPHQPEGGVLKQGVLKLEEPIPSTSQLSPQVQEQISEASNTDSDKAEEPTPEEEPPHRSLKVRLPLKTPEVWPSDHDKQFQGWCHTLQSVEGNGGRG